MELNIEKEALCVNKTICEKREMIDVQGDMIVPDSKPDILNTINTSGNASIYKKEVSDGKLRIDGNILTYIMYLADGEKDNIRGLNTAIDFSEILNIPELLSDMNADISVEIKSIECKVLNGRKISIKAVLDVNIKIYMNDKIDIVTKINNENIQVLNKTMKINSVLGSGMTKTSIKENISIPSTDNLAEILKLQITMIGKDTKISYNKVLAKSEIEIKMIYLTEEGKICTNQTKIPLVGFIDMPNIKEDNICDTLYMIKNMIIKPNTVEEHSIYIEIEAEISCIAYEEKEIMIIEDMYCPGEKIEFDQKNLSTTSNKKCYKNKCNVREKINIPELDQGRIIDIDIAPVITKENKLNGKIVYEGETQLDITIADDSTIGMSTKRINLPFEYTIDGIENAENNRIETFTEIGAQEFVSQNRSGGCEY